MPRSLPLQPPVIARTQTRDTPLPRRQKVPLAYPANLARVEKLSGPKWTGKAATHASERNKGQHTRRTTPQDQAYQASVLGKDWRSNPRAKRPQRISRAAQSELKRARISFICDLMARDQWEPAWIPLLGDKWAGHAKPPCRVAYVKSLSTLAHALVSQSFDRQELARKMLVRQETAARECMAIGTLPAFRTMARLHEATMKVAGIGRDTPVAAPAPTTTVQVYQVGGETRVRSGVMRSLFRGRELPPSPHTVDAEGQDVP